MSNPLALNGLSAPVRWCINRLSKLHILKGWYDEWLSRFDGRGAEDFLVYTLGKAGVKSQVHNEAAIAQVPEGQPLIVVSNHPLGGLEGMLLSRLLLTYRQDVKVLTNEMLLSFKEFESLFIGVDVLNQNKQAQNAKGIRQVSKHLGRGGALLVFPSGTVSHYSLKHRNIVDPQWQDIVGRLAIKYKATCLPIYVHGRNSLSFYLSGMIHPRLRTLLLPRAMISKKDERVDISVGQPVTLGTEQSSPREATDFLRMHCELLKHQEAQVDPVPTANPRVSTLATNVEEHQKTLASYEVVKRGDFTVFCAPYKALGPVAEILALERESTFSAVGEGTGKQSDQDEFDPHYWHIWAWDNKQHALVGGYRAANVLQLVGEQGVSALYSHTLFHYDQRFIDSLGGAIEVGRSFVTGPYQSDGSALDLLWHGLGHFMLANPGCHTFFGCVSISENYAPIVRALLVDTLLAGHSADPSQRELVTPVNPFSYEQRFWSPELTESLVSMSAINKLLGRVNYQYRVPALIRHYLALKGKFIDFSVNSGFNNSLDGLIYVDLRNTPARYVKRYLGSEGAEIFWQQWREKDAA